MVITNKYGYKFNFIIQLKIIKIWIDVDKTGENDEEYNRKLFIEHNTTTIKTLTINNSDALKNEL
jgi:hypothetical protein